MESCGQFKMKVSGDQFSVYFHGEGNPNRGITGRGDVTSFSRKSRSRMCDYLGSCVAKYEVMGTLTYAPDGDFKNHKQHLRAFLQSIRRYVAGTRHEKSFSLFWFLEFQGNGRPHFHFYSNFRIERYWLSATWYRIAGNGNKNVFKAGTRIESLRSGRKGQIAYAFKYASKTEQKAVPALFQGQKVGRFWGVIGIRDCVSAATWSGINNGAFWRNIASLGIIKIALKNAEMSGTAIKRADSGAFERWEILDHTLKWEIFREIKKINEEKTCPKSAITSRLEGRLASFELKTLDEWLARHWRTENHLKISALQLLNA